MVGQQVAGDRRSEPYPQPPLQLLHEGCHLGLARVQQQSIACRNPEPESAYCAPAMFAVPVIVNLRHADTQCPQRTSRQARTGPVTERMPRYAPVVMMHLMNSRFTTMARSRHRIAGGELAGSASNSRRSRACVSLPHRRQLALHDGIRKPVACGLDGVETRPVG